MPGVLLPTSPGPSSIRGKVMEKQTFPVNELQTRVQQGDAGAAKELCRRLKPFIACFVRRAFYLPGEDLRFESLIRPEISRMPLFEESLAEDGRLVAQIVARICSTLIERLRFGRGPTRGNFETIRDW